MVDNPLRSAERGLTQGSNCLRKVKGTLVCWKVAAKDYAKSHPSRVVGSGGGNGGAGEYLSESSSLDLHSPNKSPLSNNLDGAGLEVQLKGLGVFNKTLKNTRKNATQENLVKRQNKNNSLKSVLI